jgi:hypothetical protein
MLPRRIGVRIGSGRQVTRHIGVCARKSLREPPLLVRRPRRVTHLDLEHPNGVTYGLEQPIAIDKHVALELDMQHLVSHRTQTTGGLCQAFQRLNCLPRTLRGNPLTMWVTTAVTRCCSKDPKLSSQRNRPRRARWRASGARSAVFRSSGPFRRTANSLLVSAYPRQFSYAWTWSST